MEKSVCPNCKNETLHTTGIGFMGVPARGSACPTCGFFGISGIGMPEIVQQIIDAHTAPPPPPDADEVAEARRIMGLIGEGGGEPPTTH